MNKIVKNKIKESHQKYIIANIELALYTNLKINQTLDIFNKRNSKINRINKHVKI